MGDAMEPRHPARRRAQPRLRPLSLGAMTIQRDRRAGLVVVFAAGLVTRASVLKEDASLAAFYLLSRSPQG